MPTWAPRWRDGHAKLRKQPAGGLPNLHEMLRDGRALGQPAFGAVLGLAQETIENAASAAKALVGSKLDDAALDAAAAACSAACKPIDDKRGTIKYRTKIAGVLLKRVALIARDRVKGVEHHMHDSWA